MKTPLYIITTEEEFQRLKSRVLRPLGIPDESVKQILDYPNRVNITPGPVFVYRPPLTHQASYLEAVLPMYGFEFVDFPDALHYIIKTFLLPPQKED